MKQSKLTPLFSLFVLAIAACIGGCSADPAKVNGGNDGGTNPIDSGVRIDAGGEPETCNFTNCDGCCDGTTCNDDANAANCGVRGQACQTCEQGDECLRGSCATPVVTKNCEDECGGCCDGDQCLEGNTPAGCGDMGNACVTCGAEESCTEDGMCEAPVVCDSTTCPDGCCNADGSCQPHQLQTVLGCGTAGAACGTCSNDAIDCVSGICIEDQPCLDFCNEGCCTAGGQCVLYSNQDPNVCGESGTCAACPGDGDSCLGGLCTVDTVWTIIIDTAVVSALDENGNNWDTAFSAMARLPDAYVTGALADDVFLDWSSANRTDTITPNWMNEVVDSYLESDLIDQGLQLRVRDADFAGAFETIGSCVMTLTVQELQSGTKTISCGPLVNQLTLDFAPQM